MVKVGETMGSLMLSPAPKPCAKVVFPAPSGPERSMMSPPRVRRATCLPSSRMASPVAASMVTVLVVSLVALVMLVVASLMLVGSSFVADQFDGSFQRVDRVRSVGFALFVGPCEHLDASAHAVGCPSGKLPGGVFQHP